MSDQTRYELGEAVDDLRASKGCYGDLKKLLSAAMTNENCCIDGFFEFDELDPANYITFKESQAKKLRKSMSWGLLVLLLPVSSLLANGRGDNIQRHRVATIGAVVDFTSRVGKEQRIAMDLAIQDLLHSNCLTVNLDLRDSQGNSAKSTSAEIEHHQAFPTLSSFSDPDAFFDEELKKLRSKRNRVFIVTHFSLNSAVFLFRKAKEMGMMGKGYVWIVTDEIASLLDSVDNSVKYNMQGVIGIKTNFIESTKNFTKFKTRFRRLYGLQYPEEEENSSPSIFALRTYDTMHAIALAMKNVATKYLSQEIVSTEFQGLSGMMEFKNGMLSQSPTFQIINVFGRSYSEIAFWSPHFGFSDNRNKHLDMKERTNHNYVQVLGPINWPGGLQAPPKGWTLVDEERPLKIGIPARVAFNQFVKVTYDQNTNQTRITEFSIDMFEAAVKNLPYQMPYLFVPFNGSYDELVEQVYYKVHIIILVE
ncbi:hypothetical protein ACLB2K_017680 [Fragaria x ananassa]